MGFGTLRSGDHEMQVDADKVKMASGKLKDMHWN